MNIILVSQYFWPENFIINDLVKELVSQGHSIRVLTGKPNYPEGKIFPGYSKSSCEVEQYIPGVDIFRIPLRPRGKKGAKNLFLNYCSFIFNGIRFFPQAIQCEPPADVILVFAPSPVTAIIPAIFLKWKIKSHLVIWLQDLWPESLKATGHVTNQFLLRFISFVVRWIYNCSDTILVQSRGFIHKVRQLANEKKIFYYPNSFAQECNKAIGSQLLPTNFLTFLENHCCFMFAGNLGSAQALDTLLDAAKKLTNLNDFRLILVGSGSRFDYLERRIKDESLNNVVLAGRYPLEVMPEIFKRAAALIVSLTDDDLFSYTIPSKIQAYLAAGRPIIAALNGEGSRVIIEAAAGFTCPAEDVLGLIGCIERIYCMSTDAREVMGKSGRKYFMEHFEMSTQARKLIDLLNQRLKNNE